MGRGEVGKGKGDQIYGDRGNVTLGGEQTMQYADNVLLNNTLETYMLLFTSVTLINLIDKKGNPKYKHHFFISLRRSCLYLY